MAASSRSERVRSYDVYGLRVASELELSELDTEVEASDGENPKVLLEIAATEAALDAFSGTLAVRGHRASNEGPVEVLSGLGGDLLLRSEAHGIAHVSADGAVVRCAPPDPTSPAWRRFLLDTVLGTAALRRGHNGLHAAAVELGHGVVAIAAGTGTGKTTLAALLVGEGAELVCDDLLFLASTQVAVEAFPGPPVMNVPLEHPTPAALGPVLATFEDAHWIRVNRKPPGPRALATVIVLERGEDGLGVEVSGASPELLLGCALDPGTTGEQRLRRFELMAELAQRVPIHRVSIGRSCSPRQTADVIRSLAIA